VGVRASGGGGPFHRVGRDRVDRPQGRLRGLLGRGRLGGRFGRRWLAGRHGQGQDQREQAGAREEMARVTHGADSGGKGRLPYFCGRSAAISPRGARLGPVQPTAARLAGGSACRSSALKPVASRPKPASVGWISSYQKPASSREPTAEKSTYANRSGHAARVGASTWSRKPSTSSRWAKRSASALLPSTGCITGHS